LAKGVRDRKTTTTTIPAMLCSGEKVEDEPEISQKERKSSEPSMRII
jgi:hypothetical protein